MASFGTRTPYAPQVRTRIAATRRTRQREAAQDRATGRYKAAKFAIDRCPAHWTSKECYAALVRAVATRKLVGARVPESHVTLWRWMRDVRAAEAKVTALGHAVLGDAAVAVTGTRPATDRPVVADAAPQARCGGTVSSRPCGGDQPAADVAPALGPASVIAALADKPGRGVKATPLVAPLAAVVRRLAGLAAYSRRYIVKVVRRFARRFGLDVPTEHKIRYALDALGYVFHVAAAQGSRAAQFDGVPHAAVPARHPHEWWTGDTFTCPIPARGYVARGRVDGEDPYVALDCEIVVFAEGHSSAVLSWYLCDPTARPRKRREGRALRQAGNAGKKRDPEAPRAEPVCTAEEALGAFVSAALPDLAPDSTRDVAGRLPSGTLRLDRALQDVLRGPLDVIGLDVPELPGLSPPNRGMIERIIRMLKAALRAHAGARPLYAVATQTEAADAKERNKAASKAHRARPKIRLAPRDYPDIDALRAIVAQVMWEYNHTLHGYDPDDEEDGAAAEGGPDHTGGDRLVVSGGGRALRGNASVPKLTPFQRLEASLRPEHGRAGIEALLLLPHANVLMQKGGVVHDAVTFGWLPSIEAPTLTDPHTGAPFPHGMPFGVREAVELRVDPLRRGVFAYAHRGPARAAVLGEERLVFLPRVEDAALTADPGLVAKAQRDAAREPSAAARQSRYETLEAERGADAAQRAVEHGERATQARRDRAHGAKQKSRGNRPATGGAQRGGASAPRTAAAPPARAPETHATRRGGGTGSRKDGGAGRIRAAAGGERQMTLDLPASPSALPTGASSTGASATGASATGSATTRSAPMPSPSTGATSRALASGPLALAADVAPSDAAAPPTTTAGGDALTDRAVALPVQADGFTDGLTAPHTAPVFRAGQIPGGAARWHGAGDPRTRVRRLTSGP